MEYLRNASMLGPKQIGPNILVSRESGDQLNLFSVPRTDVRNLSGAGKNSTGQNTNSATGEASWGQSVQEGNQQQQQQDGSERASDCGAGSEFEGGVPTRITVIPVRLFRCDGKNGLIFCMFSLEITPNICSIVLSDSTKPDAVRRTSNGRETATQKPWKKAAQ